VELSFVKSTSGRVTRVFRGTEPPRLGFDVSVLGLLPNGAVVLGAWDMSSVFLERWFHAAWHETAGVQV
jgi:hypothetical protein